MIILGRALQEEIVSILKSRIQSQALFLDIIYVGESAVIEKYIRAKQALGERMGITVRIHRFSTETSLEEMKQSLIDMSLQTDGLLVQLPLPTHLKDGGFLECLDPSLDVDLLTSAAYGKFLVGASHRLPPVVRACLYIIEKHNITLSSKRICILGNGKLVGGPMADYLRMKGIVYDQLTKENFSPEILKNADIIISGMGAPHLVTTEMVKDGVVVLDAGTTEEGGSVLGDIHPDVSIKASLFTPVPGGIGPLTVVALFHNLIESYEL